MQPTCFDDFVSFGCNSSIGAVFGDEAGTYMKVSKCLVVIHGDVVSMSLKPTFSWSLIPATESIRMGGLLKMVR